MMNLDVIFSKEEKSNVRFLKKKSTKNTNLIY